jgi:hypothetical protein
MINNKEFFEPLNTVRKLLFWMVSLPVTMALAELPTARLLTIFPPGAKVGSTCEVTVAGIDLDDAHAIYFSDSNITAVAQTNGPGKFLVSVGTNVPVGIYDARVIGRFGISNPRRFVVGGLDESLEQSKDSVESAMDIAVGTTVNGHAQASTAQFAFQATNGQSIAIECHAAAIDSRMDPSLILYGPNGRELMQCRRGGALEFTAAESGRYTVKVHDFLFGGGSEHFYRLSVKSQPRSDERSHEEAENITPPCEVAGQFHPAGDVDRYKFDVKKGDVWWVEIFSHRLGLPTDPLLLINDQEFNDIDANVGGVEYKTSSRDAVGRFEAKEDGLCKIEVRDLFGRVVSDPRNTYRLVIRKETPDFELVAMAQGPPAKKDAREAHVWPCVLRRGQTAPIKVIALRQDGFKGDISVQAAGLPAGVSSADLVIPGDKSTGTLLVTASEAATNWTGTISIVAGTRKAKAATVIWNVPDYNNEPVQSRLADEFVLGVCDEVAPITIAAADAKAYEAPAAGKLAIPLNVTRRGDFDEAFKLKAYGVPALDSLKEIEIAQKGTNGTVELDLSQQKLSPGSHTFYLQGQTKGKYRDPAQKDKTKDVTLTVYSAPITVKVSPPQTAAK